MSTLVFAFAFLSCSLFSPGFALPAETSEIFVTTAPWPHDQACTQSILQVVLSEVICYLSPLFFFQVTVLPSIDEQHLDASVDWTLLSQEGAGFPDMHTNISVVTEAVCVMEAAQMLPLVLCGDGRVDTTTLESFAFVPEVCLCMSLSFALIIFSVCLSDLCCVGSHWE